MVALGKLEDMTALARLRERALMRENDNLKSKLSETTRALESVTSKLGKTKKKMLGLTASGAALASSPAPATIQSERHSRPRNNSAKPSVATKLSAEMLEPPTLFSGSQSVSLSSTSEIDHDDNETPRIETQALDLIGKHQAGKQRVLGRFMSIVGEFYNHMDMLPYNLRHKVSEINFSNCSLTDDELAEISKWFRFVPLHCVMQIDLSGNPLTKKSLETLFSWILSIPYPDLVRKEFLYIIATNCSILSSDIHHFARSMNEMKSPGIKLVASDVVEESLVVSIYGFTSHEYSDVSAIIKIEFSDVTSIVKPKEKKTNIDVDGICYAHRRGRCTRGDACPFPHELAKDEPVRVSQVVEVPIVDRYFITASNDVNLATHKLVLPGLTAEDRLEYERINYPRNSIMSSRGK